MNVYFSTDKMQRDCSTESLMKRRWGLKTAKKLKRRLAELAGAPTLADFDSLPAAKLHPLKGERRGQLAVALAHPYRLVFEPNHNPVPRKEDGGLDLSRVTNVLVLEVVDYH